MSTSRAPDRREQSALALAALGVVYGDIGTSPLYALRESFAARPDVDANAANILGVLSLITWSLIIVISIKYLVFVMRADNHGEGGILALTALVPRAGDYHGRGVRRLLVLVGLFGTALLYGDGVITPAISVLSAVEGVRIVTDAFDPLIIPLACVILVALFAFQRRGTGDVGRVFGPVMIIWFSVLGLLGLLGIVRRPEVLAALSPTHAVAFFVDNGFSGVLVLGSVFLVVTGGEALYADMGHFGTKPIRQAWFGLVLPGLLLNYYGQGALLLSDPSALDNPFYRLAPSWATIPLVVLATAATVIASQALISGVFSLTMQAVQQHYLPRLKLVHTSDAHIGQVYIAAVNWTLMVACIALVLGFRSSANLAAAYGVAVTTTMVVTTLLFAVVARERFGWSRLGTLSLCAAFLVVDLAFFVGNIFKIPDGGWFPLAAGTAVFVVMAAWRRGRTVLARRVRKGAIPVDVFVADLGDEVRVPGTAIYLTAVPDTIPSALLTNLRHNNALHERIMLVHVDVTDKPHVPAARRADIRSHDKGFIGVTLHYGFRDITDVPRALRERVAQRVDADLDDVAYIVGRERLVTSDRTPDIARWRAALFVAMARNSTDVAQFFHLPSDRVVEVGLAVEL